jgi:hemerythrin-like domain-containing protein
MPSLSLTSSAAEQSAGGKKDILELLFEGHEDIRSFTALALQLGHTRDASLSALSSAATRVIRFFTLELPVHTEAEDHGLVPLLFSTSLPQELLQFLWMTGRQQEELERLVDRLMPSWIALRDTPERYAELAGSLARGGRQLQLLMEEHLSMEEQILFPFTRARFSQARLMELAQELTHRRSPLS